MGIIIGKFRKKKSTEEILEKLDKEIKTIEVYRVNTEQTQKKIVGRFLLISVFVYSLTAFLFYFYFFPASFYDRLFYIIPLILAPIIIISTKKGLTWYYKRKILINQTKLRNLHEDKKKILENVMETETYKKAKTILEKYAPEQIKKNSFPVPSVDATPSTHSSVTTIAPTSGLRQRALPSSLPSQISRTPHIGFKTPLRPPVLQLSQNIGRISSTSVGSASSLPVPTNISGMPLPLPRAILPRDRSVLDKMVEYLVGDGPSNRYALICKQCSSHNGMALKEEFEYLSFRCCYCYIFNPSLKKRPPAPKLEIESKQQLAYAGTSESEKNSSSDTDSEQENKTLPPEYTENVETLYPREKEPSSDSEKNDFDKLSDAELKNSDNETTPMDVDNLSNAEIQQDIQKETEEEIKHKDEVKDEL